MTLALVLELFQWSCIVTIFWLVLACGYQISDLDRKVTRPRRAASARHMHDAPRSSIGRPQSPAEPTGDQV